MICWAHGGCSGPAFDVRPGLDVGDGLVHLPDAVGAVGPDEPSPVDKVRGDLVYPDLADALGGLQLGDEFVDKNYVVLGEQLLGGPVCDRPVCIF